MRFARSDSLRRTHCQRALKFNILTCARRANRKCSLYSKIVHRILASDVKRTLSSLAIYTFQFNAFELEPSSLHRGTLSPLLFPFPQFKFDSMKTNPALPIRNFPRKSSVHAFDLNDDVIILICRTRPRAMRRVLVLVNDDDV